MTCLKKIHSIFIALTGLLIFNGSTTEAATISQVPAQLPNFVNTAVPPLNMLLVERDNKLFFPAYNDASDLDGDGSIDIRYKPSITYLGYFDSGKCYTYGGTYFSPTSITTTKKCSGNWSGDYLNYLTTSRADALRKVLYGGYRYVDTATQTILSRAYISTNAQTWGKEYNSLTVDGYNLSDYTPYPNPTAGNYALFANNSQGTVEATYPPLLRVLPNIANVRIFGWVSREVVEGGTTATNTSLVDIPVSPVDFAVRVEACKTGFLETNCKLYPNGQYKPTGILHDYGEGNQMYFGLMTGTYTNNLQGGALRKAMGSFASEIDPSTGIFGTKTGSAYTKGAIIGTLDGLILSPLTCPSITIPLNSTCPNAGNPLAEMMYETMRYFSGTTTPTSGYLSGAADTTLGLSGLSSWTNPYSNTPNSNATPPTYPYCAKPFETLFSDVNPSYDSDLPGSSFATTGLPTATTALTSLNVSTLGSTIWNNEIGGSASINIGEVLTLNDSAPTAKTASSFGSIRGLPDEPTRQGTYDAAAVAYYANTNPITSIGSQKVQTFSIALSSTLPRIQIPLGTGTITLVPLGKVVSTAPNYSTERFSGFYIDSLYNMPNQPFDTTVNGGRAQAIFRVVYDDCTQGCDFDMDAIVLYTVAVNALGTLDVTLQTTYSAAGYESHMGYTISGTTHDGIYMEVRGGGSSTTTTNYALDTPGTNLPGQCPCTGTTSQLPGMLTSSVPVKINGIATTSHTRNFTASSTSVITNLQNPLWYAAKWGGFGDSTNTASSLPVSGQWDSNTAKTPNNYFLVTNASTLSAQLSKAFNQILQTNSSVSAPAVSQSLGTSSANSTYVNSMNVAYWSGDLTKTTTTTTTVGTSVTTSSATNWVASQQMPAWGSRQIMMANSTGTGLQSFSFSNLPANTLTSPQVDFIRGDTSNATSTYRKRASLIGDIIDSAPVIVSTANFVPSVAETLSGPVGGYSTFKTTQASRRGQVYVGANDGMLHAFDSSTGVEKFAFIPTAVIPNLSTLSASTYNSDPSLHRYFVDGTPVTSDVYFSGAWHTVLIGTLGGGGREIFALDVTNPDNITLLWEITPQSTGAADLGYSFSIPVIARLHSGNWGVVVGNGYSGNNGVAALFIIDVGTGGVTEIKTPIAGNNGLSSPVVLDSNSDGIADYVYAGDLFGNLWRFDLLGSSSASFVVSFGGTTPLYTATVSDTAGSAVQSITAPPVVVAHPSGVGVLVIFGTGRYFTTADKANTDLQTLYGIWDKQLSTTSTALARANLQAQTITTQDNSATFNGITTPIRIISNNTVDWTTKFGWYLDLTASGALLGERVVDPLVISGSVLLASTRTPSTDICSPGLIGWTYGLDPTTGGRTSFTVFNLSRSGTITSTDNYNGGVVSAFSTSAGGFSVTSGANNGSLTGTIYNSGSNSGINYNGGPFYNGRQTWRVMPSP
ncbi:PilC/PilY family type IV pilus protein [Pseudomonas sp.]|uniref:pilus assembly protein n=1 Tax=Pseudomonas sp. TaxID=306 RepID=UPI002638E111|nr:PilC/PilY family type IV pilus protein [Pseudomonas sp.]